MKGAKATKPAAKEDRATPTQRTPETAAPPEQTPGLTPSHLHRLQRMAGNAAVSRLVAQRYTAPVKPPPAQAPGFRKVQSDVAAKKQKLSQHNPAANESRSAQDAAVAPPDDKEAQGKAANAEKMNDAKPGEFNKAAFIEAVNKAIADQAPKNLDEADKFSGSGKAEKIKGEVDGKVTDGKDASSKDIETTTKAAPDTSQAKEKEVTPMKPDQPPANPGAPNAADATPQQQPPEVTDFSEGPKKTDQQMADAEVTEEQLAKSNEPEFTDALGEKKKAEQHSAQAPAQARGAEKQQLTTAKSNAAAAGTQTMATLTATRAGAGKQVDGGKGETKSKDEQKREQVTAKLQKVFDAAQKDVEGILSGLDGKVDKQFEDGEKKARDAFNKDQKRRMKQYKDKRYGGFWGPAKWAKDKIAGMPEEANQLFQESRKLYVNMMQGVISSIADTIGTELGKAKARIAQGRADIKTEVDKLPADLKQYGQEAAKDFAGKFDDLEYEVNDKSQQLVQTLAQKYTQALNAVDEEIKKLQEANKGLVQKAVDAVVGVIKTIKELKDLLMGILAKAASAIMKIIKDPIGFLGNLVRAVGAGLQQFISNIATHLQTGLVSWLLGTSAKAGIEIPSKFDLKGIIQLIASLLGLTWANIRARITRKGVPDQAMSAAEQSVPVAKALATEGPAGAAKEITAETGDLKSTILDDLKSYLIPTVIVAGITWILSLLNPASAFVRAVKGIIDIVSFIVNQGAQIVEFVNAVLDAVIAIANGGSAGVPKMVETALAASIPLLIGLLASLLGIGGLANKIKQVFQKVSRPVNRAIDKIAAKIAHAGKNLWRKLGEKGRGNRKESSDSKQGDGQGKGEGGSGRGGATPERPVIRVPFEMAGHSHTLTFSPKGSDASVTMASNDIRPFAPLFGAAHAKIDYFRHYMGRIEDPDVRKRFEAEILPWIESFIHLNVMNFRSLYKTQFPSRGDAIRTAEHTARVRRMTSQAEQALVNLKEWAAKTGIPDLAPAEIDRVIRTKGVEIWEEEFKKKKAHIEAIIGGFNYNGTPIKYRGSMLEGRRGVQKGFVNYDPKSFDVDMYVVNSEEFNRIAEIRSRDRRATKSWIAGDARYAPGLLSLSLRVAASLASAFPEVTGIGESKVVLRKSDPPLDRGPESFPSPYSDD